MAINKNFVIKNGVEIRTDLIVGDANTGRVGIATTVPRHTFHVFGGIGATNIYASGVTTTNYLNVTGFSTVSNLFVPNTAAIQVGVITNAQGSNLNYTGVSTIANVQSTNLNVSGVTTVQDFNANGLFNVYSTNAVFGNNVTINGNLSIGGTSTIINADQIRVEDKDIVLGFTTAQSPNDTTANHGGIAIASTEGYPLVPFQVTGINTLPDTYKQIMWLKQGTMGAGTTDAFLFNYGVGIGSTQVPNGIRLAVGAIQLTDDAINVKHVRTTNINATGITTSNSYNIGATQVISSARQLQNIVSLDATTTATIESAISNAPNTFTDLKVSGISTLGVTSTTDLTAQKLNVSGISTLGTVQISSGVVTATSGVVTYYGDGQYLLNVTRGVGLGTTGGIVGYGATILYFQGPGISTVSINAGIGTINVIGGGAQIGVGTTFVGIPTSGNLWYNSNRGRLFIYYQDDDGSQWVDAAPFNTGVLSGNATFDSLTVNGPIVCSDGGSFVGVVTAQDFDALSDIRYKENINTVSDALSKVTELRGVRFDWKESGLPSYGVIAQELQEVLPELVHGHNPRTVNYNGIIGVLIEAIKELKAEIEELKKA